MAACFIINTHLLVLHTHESTPFIQKTKNQSAVSYSSVAARSTGGGEGDTGSFHSSVTARATGVGVAEPYTSVTARAAGGGVSDTAARSAGGGEGDGDGL